LFRLRKLHHHDTKDAKFQKKTKNQKLKTKNQKPKTKN